MSIEENRGNNLEFRIRGIVEISLILFSFSANCVISLFSEPCAAR